MTIEIKNPETEDALLEVARRLNTDPEEAVRRMSEHTLARGADFKVNEIEVDAIIRRLQAMPVADPRPIEQLIDEINRVTK